MMETDDKIRRKLRARVELSVLRPQQVLLSGGIDHPEEYVRLIEQQTGIIFSQDLWEDLCRIQLSRNAHLIGKYMLEE